MRITSNTINFPDEVLSEMWNTIDWNLTESKVLKWQKQLSVAAFKNNKDQIKKLSIRIVSSIEAKTLAVRKVSEVLKSSPGIDNVRWIKSSDKMRAAISLSPYNYKCKPFKRFVITDARSSKERRVGIPSMYDRAMQVLYCYALEPISEATADRKSFAFRKGRSALDAHALIMDLLKEPNAPEWFLICDVQSCYDSISHKWLIENIPMNKHVLKEFLQAGFVFNNEIFPIDTGISLGCNISPILGNMTLDGVQKLLYDLQEDQSHIDFLDGYAVRFADDICIAARSRETAESYLNVLKSFLAARGLTISPNKTFIKHISSGFDFLSRFYCRIDGHIYCIPSEKAVKNFEKDLEDLILNPETKWSQKKLIQSINAKLHGWASYHRVEESMEIFKLDLGQVFRPFFEKYYNEALASGSKWLITNTEGQRMKYSNYNRDKFHKIMERLEMKHMPHDCRHSFASYMDKIEANKLCTQLIMGHSPKVLIDSVYVHKTVRELQVEIDKLETIFNLDEMLSLIDSKYWY